MTAKRYFKIEPRCKERFWEEFRTIIDPSAPLRMEKRGLRMEKRGLRMEKRGLRMKKRGLRMEKRGLRMEPIFIS